MVQELVDDIVISGLACRLPESDNAEEFWSHLMNKEDMVTDDGRRWKPGLHGLPKRSGKLKDISHFDAQFFGVHAKQAHTMDPQLRILLELTYEALIDAGVDPQTLRNSKTGVFVGASASEAGEAFSANTEEVVGYGMTGCCRAMFANRISFTFDFKGPSFAIDTACSSSLLAMDCAIQAIRTGTCDAAVVGGVSLTLKPNTAVDFLRLNMLSPDGACKSFDISGNGYCRSEGAVVIYLVKKPVAKRIYAHVVNSGTNSDGYKTQGVTYPSGAVQKALLEHVYAEAKINPGEVNYVEAHGTGTKAGDPEELNAITDVFCSRRPPGAPPLLIGSVKSNMGHPEPASGLAGVTKVVLAMQHGVLPPNLHFNTPNPDIPALIDGRLKVVTETTEWNGGLVAINSFGFGGSNVHVILKSPDNRCKQPATPLRLPTMIPCSGRTEEAVQKMCKLANESVNNDSLFSLLQDISNSPLNTFPYRGYTVVNSDEKCEAITKVQMTNRRPIWFVFSGMGTQWHGMGHKLIQLPVFRQSICNSTKALKDIGATVDLEKLITESDENTYSSTLNSFIGMAAIQIALVDCLRAAGVHPDGIIGHSVGELGCAYADGSFTAEEAIKAAYCRGKCIQEAKLPPGAMAAVGLTWEEAKRRCPPGVLPACHNAEDTVTISGEAIPVANFVQELKDEGVFAREVRTSGVAFHSHYMASIAPLLQASLEKFIVNKKRSSKWLSTSIPEEKLDSELAQYSSAAYHANNLVSPVLFQEALKKVPEHAIAIEIAPHCLLQAILKRSLSTKAAIVPLMKRGHANNLEFFMSNLGKLYMNGVNVDATVLTCGKKEYPIPLSVPSIAPHIGWDHSQEWDVPTAERFPSSGSGGSATSSNFTFEMSPTSPDVYLEGHCIDGRVLFPATGYLVLAWKTLAKFVGLLPEHVPVAFEDVAIHRATILPKTGPVTLTVHYMPASNKFDVSEGESLAVSGKMYVPENPVLIKTFCEATPSKEEVHLTSDCIYKELRLRGYDYGPTFQGILGANSSGTKGELVWNGNWVSFLDTMLQISVLRLPGRGLRLPTRIRSLRVDPSIHLDVVKEGSAVVRVDPKMDMVLAGGVELCGLHATVAPRRQDGQVPVLESFSFVPYIDRTSGQESAPHCEVDNKQLSEALSHGHTLKMMLDIVIENRIGTSLLMCEIGASESKAFSHVAPLIALHPMMQLKYTATDRSEDTLSEIKTLAEENHIELCTWDITNAAPNSINKSDLVIACNLGLTQLPKLSSSLANIRGALKPQGFLLLHYLGPSTDLLKSPINCVLEDEQFAVVSVKKTNVGSSLVLCRLIHETPEKSPIILDIDEKFEWVGELQSFLNTSDKSRIWLRCCAAKPSGIVGMTNCLRQEQGGERIRCLFDPSGNCENDIMKDLDKIRKLDLVMNVYKGGQHGSYRHVLMDDTPSATEATEHAYVNVLTRGDLSSLRWIASHLRYAPGTKGTTELCKVNYTSLNFRDIMLATGKLPPDALPGDLAHQDCILGMEFSGKNQSGQRIMGLLPAQALATTVMADQRFTWQVPDSWSLLEAASVPVVYATAYYALIVRANMRNGESVLIHSGSGGVGQAAISICLSMGCEVYTTVGTKEKREYLLKTFPQLKPENIGNSRNLTFEQMVMHNTNGRGVNIVLNSLAEEKLQASLRCLARHGRFLEIGKYDLSNNTPLGMSLFLRNIAFHGILLDAIFEEGNQDWKQVSQLLVEGIRSGAVRPLKTTVFDRDEIEDAFRFMAQGKHIGKVVIQVRPEDESKSIVELMAHARSMCDPRKSYIITGGLGGFGLELAHWLVERGARNLVLTSRRGIRTGYQARRVKVWREMGAKVVLSTNNVGLEDGAQAVVNEALTLGPLGGVFHLAVVLRDGIFENQTTQTFLEVAGPKYHGTIFLDRLTRQPEVSKDCDWFVVFSSVSSGRGNAGQTNYGFANSAMERICDKRVEDGLPGLAVQWGAIGDVGLIQDTMGGSNETVIGGTLPQRMSNCLTVLDRFLSQAQPVVSSYVLAAKVSMKSEKGSGADLVSSVAHILGVKDVDSINPDTTLADLGLDSLMGVEVRQTLERDYDIQLPMKEVRLLTVNKMRELASGGTSGKPDGDVDGKTANGRTVQHIDTDKILVPLNDFNNGDKPVFVVHNINGTVEPLRSLASKLSRQVYGLQNTPEAPSESVANLAAFYIQHIRQVQPQGPYILVGYSFGACLAIEMAMQLEKTNEVENLVLLDGSHTYVEAHTVFHRKRLTVEEESWGPKVVSEALCAIAAQFMKIDKIKLLEKLQAENNIANQITTAASFVATANPSYDKEHLVWRFSSFLNLLRMGEQYKATSKYQGRVMLVRAKTSSIMNKELGDDFRLHEVCENGVTLKWVEGDHESFIQDNGAVEVANIITETLA